MKKIILASAFVLATLATGASAQDRGWWGGNSQREIDARQERQESRIQQGQRSGDITRREAAALEAEQARIREMERRAQRDGRVDRREAAEIRDAQNAASRHINEEANDRERRGGWKRWW